jgi:meso-butanediol dehydrogenase / (S,S)-butanediol dehydrogenase / diacetyl reductase
LKLLDKVAIVTGAGGGIGRGIALCLAEEGADVVINDINQDRIDKVATEIRGLGRKSISIKGNVTKSPEVSRCIQETVKAFGKINILVNNVGGHAEAGEARTGTGIVQQTEAEWDEAYEINLKSQFLMCKGVVPFMRRQGGGKIINISSIAGKLGDDSLMYYSAMKGGVITFTRALAREVAKDNIQVNSICPGLIYTPAWERLAVKLPKLKPEFPGVKPRDFFLQIVKQGGGPLLPTPLGREQTPEDIGRAVVFFASEDAKNITGQSLNVDGGIVMD